ncbi:MAG: MFS transporter [Actinomycetia bacterium]|nr:MFS transporter [Actinomycetes bacterium]
MTSLEPRTSPEDPILLFEALENFAPPAPNNFTPPAPPAPPAPPVHRDEITIIDEPVMIPTEPEPAPVAAPPAGSAPESPEAAADGSEFDPVYAKRLLVTVLLAVISFSSSMTIVSASLPAIAADLNSSESTLAWSVTGLFLVMAVATPILGRLGDIRGHRQLFLVGAAVLTLATGACGLAPNTGALIGARMFVGLGIAATMPTGMALIFQAYPVSRRAEAMGWYQMAMTGAPVIGLVIGGPMIDAWGWRTVFALLTPIALAGFIAAWRTIKPSTPGEKIPIDWWGAAFLGGATLSFLLALEQGKAAGMSDPLAVGLIAVAAGGVAAFIEAEKVVPSPMLKLRYFRRPNFTGPLIAQPLMQFAYMGGFLISPLLLDSRFGYGVTAIALILLFRPGVFSLASPVGGRLSGAYGARVMIASGSVAVVLSMIAFAGAAQWTSLPLMILGLGLSGLGLGISNPSVSTTMAAAVDPADMGIANGMGSTMMNIGMLTGIQTMFVILGDGREASDFATVYLFGAVVAAVSIFGGLIIRTEPSP